MKAQKWTARLGWSARKLAHDARGMSAVETALLLPVMLMIYLGTVEVTMAVSTYRQVDLTANTVTNLVAQYSTISASAQMPDILNAAAQVMYPNPSANVKVVVSLITINSKGAATVTWSQTLNGTARTIGSSVTLPSGLAVANTSVVLGETTYPYSATIDFLNLGTINLTSSLYMVPRASTTINLTS